MPLFVLLIYKSIPDFALGKDGIRRDVFVLQEIDIETTDYLGWNKIETLRSW